MQPLYLVKRFCLPVGLWYLAIASSGFAESDNKQSSDTRPEERRAIVCDPNKADYRACVHQHFKKDLFTKAAVLQCGETELVITTACMDTKGGGVYCFTQNLVFLNFLKGEEGMYKTVTYSHPADGPGEPFVTGVSCIKVDKKYYVRARNTNFGNCLGCEWSDFFTNQGKYLGSTGSDVYGRTSFVRKSITNRLYDRVMDGEWIEQEDDEIAIDIIRIRDR